MSEIYSADYYLERCGGVEFFTRYKAEVLKPTMQLAIRRADLKPGMKILDVGCGRGELAAHLTTRGFDAVGIDVSPDAVAVAKKYFPNVHYVCGDLLEQKFQSASFDRVFFLSTIEHLSDEKIGRIFEEFRRLLKPGGLVIATTCTNLLYYKTWSYTLRRAAGRLLNRLGLNAKVPHPPRSDEDQSMHVNEQDFFSLRRFFSTASWNVTVEPRVNPKLCVREIYGRTLPPNFPLKDASLAKKLMFRLLMVLPFVNLLVTRSNLLLLKAR